MNDIDITLYLNEYRVRALADALGSQTAETVEDKLTEAFDTLYQEYVPDEQRASIEATIESEYAAEQANTEAARRFAVYHIRENGDDYHFTSDIFRTPMQAAYRYRLYERGELSAHHKTFAAAFIETSPTLCMIFPSRLTKRSAQITEARNAAVKFSTTALREKKWICQKPMTKPKLRQCRCDRRVFPCAAL